MSAFTQLNHLTQAQLEWLAAQAQEHTVSGVTPSYIPLLATADAHQLIVQVRSCAGWVRAVGAVEHRFVLMSVIKPFLLLFLLEHLGMEQVMAQVGTEPSLLPFNSVQQLEADQGWTRNPMINSGAIVLASLLPGQTAAMRCEGLQRWLNHQANCTLSLDVAMLDSVRSTGGKQNRAIAELLVNHDRLADADLALDTYNHICCLAGTIADLAQLGLLLGCTAAIARAHQQFVNQLLLTCGLYEASAEVAAQIGLPMKSGVSGALLAVVPEEGAVQSDCSGGVIACYGPALDCTGNSLAGLAFLKHWVDLRT